MPKLEHSDQRRWYWDHKYTEAQQVAAVAAASVEVVETALQAGAGLDAEERRNEEQRMPESASGAGFVLGPLQVVLG